jgi:hypothetical protein
MPTVTIHGSITGRVLFTMWGWCHMVRIARELEQRGLPPLPVPPEYMRLEVLLFEQFKYLVNIHLPEGLHFVAILGTQDNPPPVRPHTHANRQGNPLTCVQAFALQQDPHYVLVANWESEDQRVMVSTAWTGEVPKLFETRVFSSVEALNGITAGCHTEELARKLHQDAIDACSKYLNESS